MPLAPPATRPLATAAWLLAGILACFSMLVWGVTAHSGIPALDASIDRFLAAHRERALTRLFLGLTFLGRGPVIAGCALLLACFLLLFRRRHLLVPLALTLGGAEASVQLVKRAVGRIRPDPSLAYHVEHSFSFPSAHATLAAALYGFVAYAMVQGSPGNRPRRAAACAACLVAVGIGFSRIYLGVHYPSDVAGGFLLGLAWLVAGIALAEIDRP